MKDSTLALIGLLTVICSSYIVAAAESTGYLGVFAVAGAVFAVAALFREV
jgi:hypothetical protein